MRPLELKLRNFRSYFGDGAVFDFRERRLVGIVGPIGSGKSTVLDAMSFALYGKTPAIAAATKSLIHQRAKEGAVSLRFEVEGEIWEAVRMLRRKGASQHVLYRYASDDDEEPIEKLALEAQVNEKIVHLLGLEFDAFRRSVLLAQGRFAEFLSARPADRDKVLKGLFGHDRIDEMRELAKERATFFAAEVMKQDVQLKHLDQAADELSEMNRELEQAQADLQRLKAVEPEARRIAGRSHRAVGLVDKADTRLAKLAERDDLLPSQENVAEVVAASIEARSFREHTAKLLAKASSDLETAKAALAVEQESGLPSRIEEASLLAAALVPLQTQFTEAEVRLDRAMTQLRYAKRSKEEAVATVSTTAATLNVAKKRALTYEDELVKTRAELHDAEHANMITMLRSELDGGDVCPVCTQKVSEIPVSDEAPGLENSRSAYKKAETEWKTAEGERSAIGEEHAAALKSLETAEVIEKRAADEVAAVERDVEKASGELAETKRNLENRIGHGDPEQLILNQRQLLVALQAAVSEARTVIDRLRVDHDQAIQAEQETERAGASISVELADAAARAGLSEFSFQFGDDLLRADAALRSAITAAMDEARLATSEASQDLDKARQELTTLLSTFNLEEDLSAALVRETARVDLLQADCEKRRVAVEEASTFRTIRETAERNRVIHDRIASDLTDARFVRYLLDEERARLAELGGEHFLRLSSGRYLFADDGHFSIIDQTAAEIVRKSDTLSGGEIFLASLALALSLTEMVSRTGGRLDSFFLDEGFGSLDPEHLDLAMDGIEALVAGERSRLVVVVSHVPEMRERIEDLIELDRDPSTGDTWIASGASLSRAEVSSFCER